MRSECAASASTVTVTVSGTSSLSPTLSNAGGAPGTSTTSTGLIVPTAVLDLDCPGLNTQGQQVVTLGVKSWRFTPTCGTDYQGNDIGGSIVYSFSDCLKACAAHNFYVGKDECVAVHFNANMPFVIATYYGDCFLKNGTKTQLQGLGNLEVTAVLVSSK